MHQSLRIETRSLTLRRLAPADAEKIFQMSREQTMRRWLYSQVYRDQAHAASVLAYLVAQYDTGKDPKTVPLVLGVQLRNTGELVGHVGLSPLGEAVEIGFAIEQAQQGKGFATEAVRAMCTWANATFPIQSILGLTAPQNFASQKVLLRAGFQRKMERVMRFQGSEQPVVFFEFSTPNQL